MKRDFLLGGTKLPTGGAVRGAGGAMSPPVFMLKEALPQRREFLQSFWDLAISLLYTIKVSVFKVSGNFASVNYMFH